MDYFLQFHWWYLLVAVVLFFVIFGKKKGGVVATRVSAELETLDDRFQNCRAKADYMTFTNDSPDHIDIEIKQLPLKENETLEFLINGKLLAEASVRPNLKAKFDHWADEDVEFPVVKSGDELIVIYDNSEVLKGTFISK